METMKKFCDNKIKIIMIIITTIITNNNNWFQLTSAGRWTYWSLMLLTS